MVPDMYVLPFRFADGRGKILPGRYRSPGMYALQIGGHQVTLTREELAELGDAARDITVTPWRLAVLGGDAAPNNEATRDLIGAWLTHYQQKTTAAGMLLEVVTTANNWTSAYIRNWCTREQVEHGHYGPHDGITLYPLAAAYLLLPYPDYDHACEVMSDIQGRDYGALMVPGLGVHQGPNGD